MSKTLTLRSKFLNILNESLQKISIENGIKVVKNPFMEADGNFTSVIQTNNTFNPNDINSNIMVDDESLNQDPNLEDKKDELIKKATETITQSLKVSDELQSILNQINKINKDMGNDTWKINEEGNTATLLNKNARIFKQNDNLCLSHNGEVELFNNVPELHQWLKDNNYPLPKNIKLHEDAEDKSNFSPTKSAFGKWGEWLDNITDENNNRIGDRVMLPGETEDMTPEERKALANKLAAGDHQKPIMKMGKDAEKEMRNKLPKDSTKLNQYTSKELNHILYNKPLDKNKLGDTLKKDESLNEETGFWYLQYEDMNHDQILYLNDAWREGNLLTNSLDQASAFMTEEDALRELDEVYQTNNTQYPFKPIQDGTVNECFGTSTGSLGSAVQFLGDKKKDTSLNEQLLDEISYSRGARDIYGNMDTNSFMLNNLTSDEQQQLKNYQDSNIKNRIKAGLQLNVNAPSQIYTPVKKDRPWGLQDMFVGKDIIDHKTKRITNVDTFIQRCQKWVDHLSEELRFDPHELMNDQGEYTGSTFFNTKGKDEKARQLAKQRAEAFYNDFQADFWQWGDPGAKSALFGNTYYNTAQAIQNLAVDNKYKSVVSTLRNRLNTYKRGVDVGKTVRANAKAANVDSDNFTSAQYINPKTKDFFNFLDDLKNAKSLLKDYDSMVAKCNKLLQTDIDNLSDDDKYDISNKILSTFYDENNDFRDNTQAIASQISPKNGSKESAFLDDIVYPLSDFADSLIVNIEDNDDEDLGDLDKEIDPNEFKYESTNLYDAFMNQFKNDNIPLKEDDSPADFATGFKPGTEADKITAGIDAPDTNTTSSDSSIETPDIGNDSDVSVDNGTPDVEFGDINVGGGNYSPNETDDEEMDQMPQMDMPEYRIIDVLVNDKDDSDIKVKVQDTKTGKTEIKNLYEIDV